LSRLGGIECVRRDVVYDLDKNDVPNHDGDRDCNDYDYAHDCGHAASLTWKSFLASTSRDAFFFVVVRCCRHENSCSCSLLSLIFRRRALPFGEPLALLLLPPHEVKPFGTLD